MNLPEYNPYDSNIIRRESRAIILNRSLDEIQDLAEKSEQRSPVKSFTVLPHDGKGEWESLGPLVIRVHEDSTRYDATFYIKASPSDEIRLRKYHHFPLLILTAQGLRKWITWVDVIAPAMDGWLILNVHFDMRWMPNPGVHELQFVEPFIALWREQAVEEYNTWERHQIRAGLWLNWADKIKQVSNVSPS